METTHQKFVRQVEAFLLQSGMDATNFGKQALKQPNFVFDIRRGRSPTLKTIDKCLAFMKAHEAPKDDLVSP